MAQSLKSTDKDTIKINDSDGELHFYVCAAFQGKRWAAQVVLKKDKRTITAFTQQGTALILATAKSLLKAKTISE